MNATRIAIASQFLSMAAATTLLAQTLPSPSVASLGDCHLTTGAVLPIAGSRIVRMAGWTQRITTCRNMSLT